MRERVLAVLVVHGEQPWQDVVATRLAEQACGPDAPRLLVVDNGGAPAAVRIAEAADADLLELPRARGFGGAVAAAAGHPLARDAEFLLLLHDDLILEAEAVRHMVAVMDTRPEVAITGPKLLDWQREPALQQVGMTIDAMGRAENHLETGEVDQGQHDHRDRALYVSTAGMLVRREVFLELGGFDPRFTAMRDDLDLCWRAWLAGSVVEVVPEAVAWHVAAASRSVRRRGWGRRATTRYLAERHTLAAMIKNLGLMRLAWTLPVHMLLALAKAVGFVLTRRLASAGVPFAAAAWNVKALPGTLRLRRSVQRTRRRSDAEMAELFAAGRWRTRAYAEALADWMSGAGTRSLVADDAVRRRAHRSERSTGFRALDLLRDHPALLVGGALALLWILACIPLLGGGQLMGGAVMAWPERAGDFLAAYVSGWGTGPFASDAFPAPVQPVLFVLSAVVGGGAWLAQRLVVLGIVPVIWLLSLRAGRLLTAHPGPRVVGATFYAGSPVVLGAFGQGRLDILVVALALPGALLLVASASLPGVPPGRAWRATAFQAVVTAVAVAAAPFSWPVLVLPLLAVAALAAQQRAGRLTIVVRLAVAALGAAGLLLPWLLGLRGTTLARLGEPYPVQMWEALSGRVGLLPWTVGAVGWIWLAAAGAVILAALGFGLRRRAGTVLALLGTVVAFAAATAVVSRQPDPFVWPPTVMLPAALALAGLAVTAARSIPSSLRAGRPRPGPAATRGRRATAGLRAGAAAVLAIVVAAGPLAVLAGAVATGSWPELRRDPQRVPLFVEADAERVGPYRILLLEGDETQVRWDVTEPGGPMMTAFGTRPDADVHAAHDRAVTGLLSGDPAAAGLAGVLNVRYVVLRDAGTRAAVEPALADLAGIEPMAAGSGTVYQVRTWLPRAAVVAPAWMPTALAGEPLPAAQVEAAALDRLGVGVFGGGPVEDGVLAVSEARTGSWVADAGGRRLDPLTPGPGVPTAAFTLEGPSERVVVDAVPRARAAWLAWQAAVLLGLLSLALRAPGQPVGGRTGRPGVLPDVARAGTRPGPVVREASQ